MATPLKGPMELLADRYASEAIDIVGSHYEREIERLKVALANKASLLEQAQADTAMWQDAAERLHGHLCEFQVRVSARESIRPITSFLRRVK